MSDNHGLPPGAHLEAYSRHGLEGPYSFVVRPSYTSTFVRVEGDYAPITFSVCDAERAQEDDAMPVALLAGEGMSVSAFNLNRNMGFALRNVAQDELFVVVEGRAQLETDFGVLQVGPSDVVLIPRAVSYRFVELEGTLRSLVLGVPERILIDPQNVPASLNPFRDVRRPDRYPSPISVPGEYHVLVRHVAGTTRYIYDSDPLPILHTEGAPVVQAFNIADIYQISVDQGTMLPSLLVRSGNKKLLVFGVGQRRVDPIDPHHNADFAELTIFVEGPGPWGTQTEPGTVTWTPRGVVHHGPSENVANPWKGFLVEIAAELLLTDAGRRVSRIMNPGDYSEHTQGAVAA